MKKLNYITALCLFAAVNLAAFSQTTPAGHSETEAYSQLAGAMVFLLVAFMFILFFVLSAPKYEYSKERRKEKYSFLAKISKVLNRGVPVEQEKDIMMDHDFDGIRELNNTVPPWFNMLFYGTVIIAIIYFVDFHVLGSGNVMVDEYVEEIRIANEKREELIRTGAFINENNVTQLMEAAELEKGKQVFSVSCTPCHGMDAGGTVGPNLTDKHWIHGGGIKNVFATIVNGVPAKGMISWKTSLTPKQIQQVASYILSLQGTNPPTGKPPEGNLWVEETVTDSTKTGDSNKVKTDFIKVKSDTLKTKTDTTKVKKDSVKTK